MKTSTLTTIKTIILALILAVGVQFVVAAGTWTSAPANPPANNVDAPINTSTLQQAKMGALWVNTDTSNPNIVGLVSNGESWFNGRVKIVDGTQAAGKVLTSDANGYTSWQSPSTSAGIDPTTLVSFSMPGVSDDAVRTTDLGRQRFCTLSRMAVVSTDDDDTSGNERSPACRVTHTGDVWSLSTRFAACDAICIPF